MNYYNEIDPGAAAWLRELIADGQIPAGDVDERSIEDVRPDELMGYTQCHFFAGIGGWSLALRLAGIPDSYRIWTGSCPCQPFSAAGAGKGTDDERHLWPHFAWLIRQCRPAKVAGEQVASKSGRAWFAGVRADLEALGYAVAGADLCAAGVGAPHIRQRLLWAADALQERNSGLEQAGSACKDGSWWPRSKVDMLSIIDSPFSDGACWPQPLLRAVDDGVSSRVVGVSGSGNAIVPQVGAEFLKAWLITEAA